MIASPMIEVKGLTKRFGGLTAVDDVDFHVDQGEIVSLIGPNGSGKTTFFHLLAGFHEPDAGEIRLSLADGAWLRIDGLKPHDIRRLGLARTFQTREIFPGMSVLDCVLCGMHPALRSGLAASVFAGRGFRQEEARARERAIAILEMFPGRFGRERWAEPASSLSFANRCRLEIAMCLASNPRLLLIDEPAAGMNPVERVEIMATLKSIRDRGYTLVVVEHNMRLVLGLSDRIVVFDRGRKIADDRPDRVMDDPKVAEAYLGTHYDVA